MYLEQDRSDSGLSPAFARHTHPKDDGMLLLREMDDLPALSSDDYTGGILTNAMPENVIRFFQNAPIEQLRAFSGSIKIDPLSGETRFTEQHASLPSYVRDFLASVSVGFNKIGPWPAVCGIALHLQDKPNGAGFHPDTRPADEERQVRGLITIPDKEATNPHETEWIAKKGLTEAELKHLLGNRVPIEQLPEAMQGHIEYVQRGDLLVVKSLGEGYDLLAEACLHRPTPAVQGYSAAGKRRVAAYWERQITPYCDPA